MWPTFESKAATTRFVAQSACISVFKTIKRLMFVLHFVNRFSLTNLSSDAAFNLTNECLKRLKLHSVVFKVGANLRPHFYLDRTFFCRSFCIFYLQPTADWCGERIDSPRFAFHIDLQLQAKCQFNKPDFVRGVESARS